MRAYADLVAVLWLLLPLYADSTKESVMLEISKLLRSDSRKNFPSDQHYFEAHEKLLSEIKRNPITNIAHPFVLSLYDNCLQCHDALMNSVSSTERYRVISANTAIFYGNILEIEFMRWQNFHSIKHYVPLIHDAKIDRILRSLFTTAAAEDCPRADAGALGQKSIRISIVIAPMPPEELQNFADEMRREETSLIPSGSPRFTFNLEELRAHVERSAHVTVANYEDVEVVVKMLSQRREVLWMERSHEIRVSNKWGRGLSQSGVYSDIPIYAANLTGENQIVGVADTGLDMQSCYFIDPSVPIPYNTVSTKHRKVVTYITYQDYVDDSVNGHGTHVCGSLLGKCNKESNEYKAFNGVAYNAKIAFFDIGIAGSYTLNPPSNLESSLFGPMYSAGARIFSNSWGAPSDNSYNYLSVSVDRFMWNNPDTLVIFAAGNDGPYASSIDAPSTNKNGIAVGASLNDYNSWLLYGGSDTNSDTSDSTPTSGATVFTGNSAAFFSSQGPTADGRLKPDVMAPGWWITSTASAAPPTSESGAVTYNSSASSHCSLKGMRGTSMSTPAVAGSAALIREYFTKGFYPSGVANSRDAFIPSGALIKAMLIHSARPLTYTVTSDSSGHQSATALPTDAYPTNLQGFGRIQLNNVLHFTDSKSNPLILFVIGAAESSNSNYKALRNGETEKHIFYTTSDVKQPSIRITLAYTDYPGSSGASRPLVNDLNIVVVDNSGTILHRSKMYVQGQSNLNNVEIIMIDNPIPSTTYTVVVSSTNQLAYAQPYALVMTGQITPVRLRTVRSFVASIKHFFNSPLITTGFGLFATLLLVLLALLVCLHINRRQHELHNRRGTKKSSKRMQARFV